MIPGKSYGREIERFARVQEVEKTSSLLDGRWREWPPPLRSPAGCASRCAPHHRTLYPPNLFRYGFCGFIRSVCGPQDAA